MSGQARFVLLLASVSALLPLAGVVLVRGVHQGQPLAVLAGVALGLTALAGLLVLGRTIVVFEQRRARR